LCRKEILLVTLFAAFSSIFPQSKSTIQFQQKGSTITCENARFEFLSPTLVRMEYSPSDDFVNSTTAVVVNRNWKSISINAEEKNGWLIAKAGKFALHYHLNSGKFTKDNLKITWEDENSSHTWAPGDSDKENLGGISYSLDGINKKELPKPTQGILSRNGYFLLDDSHTPVWDSSSAWIKPRSEKNNQDWYFFEYGKDFSHVLEEYARLCGKIPMVPRYILGGWITDLNYEYLPSSRLVKNYNYSYKNIENEIMRFRKEGIPLDVMVLDFAWHKYGWQGGYDWSPIFPRPKKFLNWAHGNGIKVTLNDHPGYGNESVLSDSDSQAKEIRKALNIPILHKAKFSMNIQKDWRFSLDNENVGETQKWFSKDFNDSKWAVIQAGREWENQGFPGYDGYAWYRKLVVIPENIKPTHLYLIFGGVDDSYDLFINGKKVAHYGNPGHSVFNTTTYTDILPFIESGTKTLIALRVDDWGGGGGLNRLPVEISDELPPAGIRFNLAKKNQAEVFMKVLHDPLIKEGVNFWWIDGGNGSCEMKGLNSQMWTNRVFYNFTQKYTGERTFIFSRYGGWGNHRYPGMFTGDTFSQWAVLNYEVPFTARGGNVLMPYVTHDIGGFHGAKIDFDLYARWVEFGALSPILRLHSAHENPEEGNLRMPWTYGDKGINLARKFFRLRYSLIPYIYTYCRIAHDKSLPLIRPLYLEYPKLDKAYSYPEEYFFGSEILVAPVTNPDNKVEIYLPPGEWYDYFTGEKYEGNQVINKIYPVDDIPMFVKAGSIIPTEPVREYIGQRPLDSLEVNVYGSKSGKFNLYEDDGISLAYESGKFAWTPISFQKNSNGESEIKIGPTKGNFTGQVKNRVYHIKVYDISNPVLIQVNGKTLSEPNNGLSYWNWDSQKSIVNIYLNPKDIRQAIDIVLK